VRRDRPLFSRHPTESNSCKQSRLHKALKFLLLMVGYRQYSCLPRGSIRSGWSPRTSVYASKLHSLPNSRQCINGGLLIPASSHAARKWTTSNEVNIYCPLLSRHANGDRLGMGINSLNLAAWQRYTWGQPPLIPRHLTCLSQT
jgi:hypothetical protein